MNRKNRKLFFLQDFEAYGIFIGKRLTLSIRNVYTRFLYYKLLLLLKYDVMTNIFLCLP